MKKRNICIAAIVACGYLAVFLAGKLILNRWPDMTLWEWLGNTDPQNHSYLFGWLVMKNRYLICALISVLPALLGKQRFATASFIGFSLGLLCGEAYDFFTGNTALSGSFPYSWQLWFSSFLATIIAGVLLEIQKKKS